MSKERRCCYCGRVLRTSDNGQDDWRSGGGDDYHVRCIPTARQELADQARTRRTIDERGEHYLHYDTGPGSLLVGVDPKTNDVTVQLPPGGRSGHINFTPDQAILFAVTLVQHANRAAREIDRQIAESN